MCTVSWFHHENGYELFCNRDELQSRKPAAGPRIHRRRGVHYISPADGDHGGSWIGVNEFRLSLCLVNRYTCCTEAHSRMFRSRGILLHHLLDSRSLADIHQRIRRTRLEAFRPFAMVGLEPGKPAMIIHWNGHYCLVECEGDYAMPLVSSSFDSAGVAMFRQRLLRERIRDAGQVDSKLLEEFHRSHIPAPCAYSPCMHRQGASTVSFSRISVGAESVEFAYSIGAPCEDRIATVVRLPVGLTERIPPAGSISNAFRQTA